MLYSIPTRLMEMLLINSDEPFVQALSIAFPSKLHRPRRRMLSFSRPKYISGTRPPTVSLSAVAAAAPASLYSCGRSITNTASITMFVTPDITVTVRPRRGFSAVTQKDWKRSCNTLNGRARSMMRA